MGTAKLVERLSLKGLVIWTLILILLSSLLATFVTFGLIILWGGPPATFYHQVEGKVSGFISQEGVKILNPSEQAAITHLLDGMPYQMVNNQGQVLYGTIQEPILHSQMDLIQHVNTTEVQGRSRILLFDVLQSTVTRYIPIYSADGTLRGALILRNSLNAVSTHPSARGFITFLSYLIPIVPFLYFCLFSYLFAKRFGKRMNKPLQVLVKGAQRIEQQDLDFVIERSGPYEIRQVLVAFENMRSALKDALVRQWQLEEERGHMISAISHDLRTPLTVIQGHVESLLEGAMQNSERLERYLETVMHNTKRVIQLMEDMQKITEIDQPDFTLHPVHVQVRKYLVDWTRDFELMTSKADVELVVEIQDERQEEAEMYLDPERISQVMDNIVSNSIRFTPRGGRITIHVDITAGALTCEVVDTGKGFSKADLGHMFERFYQGDAARTATGHSGLGLYIAKTLVGKHGGEITAGNNPEGGAFVRFTVRELPR